MARSLWRRSLVGGLLLAATCAAWAGYDLKIVSVQVIAPDCYAVVTLANAGTEALPNWAFDDVAGVRVRFWLDGQGLAFYNLGSSWRTKLQAPGSQVDFVCQAKKLSGSHTLKVFIDEGGVVAETDEANNVVETLIQCAPALPDIQIQSVQFTQDCKIKVVLANAGDGVLGNNSYDNLYLQRTYDGHPGGQLRPRAFETNRALAQPGATLEIVEVLDPPVTQWVEYGVVVTGDEKSQDHKTQKAWLPVSCGGPGDPAGTGSNPGATGTGKVVKVVPGLKPVPVKPIKPIVPKK